MTVHLDTTVLIDAFCHPYGSRSALRATVVAGHRIALSTLVLSEWLRGPRDAGELATQEAALPAAAAAVFDAAAARTAARLYRSVRRARGRELDLMIAACAIEHDAVLWTLNPGDFDDVPGLALYRP